jgi:copper chaperone NosL
MRRTAIISCIIIFMAAVALAGEKGPVTPAPNDKCPVCGMFVKKYPDWTSQIVFRDRSYAVFDGVKDMFKYYFGMKKYNPSHVPGDVDSIYVIDYYSLRPTDGRKANYVIGSDVYGPMGRELIPFAKIDDAKEFLKDHRGKRVLRFDEVTQEIIQELDR